jgi:hypothetical protein
MFNFFLQNIYRKLSVWHKLVIRVNSLAYRGVSNEPVELNSDKLYWFLIDPTFMSIFECSDSKWEIILKTKKKEFVPKTLADETWSLK